MTSKTANLWVLLTDSYLRISSTLTRKVNRDRTDHRKVVKHFLFTQLINRKTLIILRLLEETFLLFTIDYKSPTLCLSIILLNGMLLGSSPKITHDHHL